jgi:hypothetical protein
MNALTVSFVDRLMTARAGLGNTRLWNTGASHIVSPVAIDAKRRFQFSSGQYRIVNAVECFRIVVEMTPLAALVICDGEFSEILECPWRMGIGVDVTVAIRASHLLSVNGTPKPTRVHVERALLSAR